MSDTTIEIEHDECIQISCEDLCVLIAWMAGRMPLSTAIGAMQIGHRYRAKGYDQQTDFLIDLVNTAVVAGESLANDGHALAARS